MIIDAHNHPDWHGHNVERFVENMAAHHIDRTWLLTWECPPDEYDPSITFAFSPNIDGRGPMSLSKSLPYMQRYPEKFVLGYAPDPRRPEAIDQLAAAIDSYGVRVCGEIKLRMMYDNPDALRLYRFCGEKGLPVTFHLDYEFDTGSRYPRPNWWYGGPIEAFERAIQACPNTIFLGHGPGFWAHISNDGQFDKVAYPKGEVVRDGKITQMLRAYPNLYCDMSAGSGHGALARDLDHARDFLTEFQDRVLYARDYFDNRHQNLLNSLGLPQSILDKIYAGNALRLVPEK